MTKSMHTQKVTVTIPYDLKDRLNNLKEDMKTSVSAIYKEALENYLEQKEIEKWEKGATLASKDIAYQKFITQIDDKKVDDIYEY